MAVLTRLYNALHIFCSTLPMQDLFLILLKTLLFETNKALELSMYALVKNKRWEGLQIIFWNSVHFTCILAAIIFSQD